MVYETKVEIVQQLKEIIVRVSGLDLKEEDISEEEGGIKALNLNSLAIIRMIVEMEKIFEVEIDFEETEAAIASLADLAQFVMSKKSA